MSLSRKPLEVAFAAAMLLASVWSLGGLLIDAGLHRGFVLKHGAAATANMSRVAPGARTRRGGVILPTAWINYQRGPEDAPTVDVTVTHGFYEAHKDARDVPVAIHFFSGALGRVLPPVIDADAYESHQRNYRNAFYILCAIGFVCVAGAFLRSALRPVSRR